MKPDRPHHEWTPRQREVLDLLVLGRTNAEIADALGISLDGAKWHVREIISILGIDGREEAAEYWRRERGLVARFRSLARVLWFLPRLGLAKAAVAGLAIAVPVGVAVAIVVISSNGAKSEQVAQTLSLPAATSASLPSAVAAATAPVDPQKLPTEPEVISAFSPRSLAFIRDGNLWVADGVGTTQAPGHEVQVTRNGGLSSPSWSFSGQWLIVSGFGKWWLISMTGEVRELSGARSSTAAWSPTEDDLAYTAADGIYVFDVASETSRRLLDMPGDGIAWSPDGTKLAVGNDHDRPDAQSLPAPAVTVVSVRTGAIERLPMSPVMGTETIVSSWTSDGQTVLAWVNPILSASIRADGVALYAVRLAGGEPVKLGTTLLYRDYVSPRPGRSAVVAFVDGGFRTAWEHKSLAIARSDGSTSAFPGAVSGAVASSAWSPDGSRIAYVAGPELPGVSGGDQAKADLMQRRIWVQSAAGGPATMLTDDPAYRDEHPQWGSNQCIVFARVNRDDELTLWFADLNNASVQQITDAFSFADPQTTWFGYYGHIAWDAMYDWWPAHGYDLADRADACNMP